MGKLVKLIGSGILATPAGESFPLDRVREAVQAGERPGRPGKVLLRIGQR